MTAEATARPGWDEYFLGMATAASARADCTRRKVGCVIVGSDRRVVSTGYNGSPAGEPSCLQGACPRGRHYRLPQPSGWSCPDSLEHAPEDICSSCMGMFKCSCGQAWPCDQEVAAGSSYDTGAGSCISVHAEANALIYADRHRLTDATAYITAEPCGGCRRLLAAADLVRVVWLEEGGKRGEWRRRVSAAEADQLEVIRLGRVPHHR